MVISSRLGNRFCRVATNTKRKNIYLYLIEDSNDETGHFHGIGSINGFFGYGYFCTFCLLPYKNKGRHSCLETCGVCGSHECKASSDEVICSQCHRTCRSEACFKRHATNKFADRENDKSMCERFYQCQSCQKIINREKRAPEKHRCGEWKCKNCFEYQLGEHLCYQRKPFCNLPKKQPRKYFFYNFETTQNEKMARQEGHSLEAPCGKKMHHQR